MFFMWWCSYIYFHKINPLNRFAVFYDLSFDDRPVASRPLVYRVHGCPPFSMRLHTYALHLYGVGDTIQFSKTTENKYSFVFVFWASRIAFGQTHMCKVTNLALSLFFALPTRLILYVLVRFRFLARARRVFFWLFIFLFLLVHFSIPRIFLRAFLLTNNIHGINRGAKNNYFFTI